MSGVEAGRDDGPGSRAGQPRAGGPEIRRSWPRNWALTGVVAVLVLVVFLLHRVLLPFVIAGGVSFVLDPLIRRAQPHLGNHRWIPATILYLVLLVAGAAFVWWVGRTLAADFAMLSQNGPRMIHDLAVQLVGPDGSSIFGKKYTADALVQQLQTSAAAVVSPQLALTGTTFGIGAILGVFLILVLTPYFMISGPSLVEGMVWLIPPERRDSGRRTLAAVVPALRRYFVGVAAVVTFTGVVAYLGFGLVFALPHAVLLSLAVGVLEIIPALGPFASMVLVALWSVQEHSLGTAALLMGYAILLRLVIDNALGPLVLGRAAKLHPVAIIFSFICGASLFGVMGLLLAVPTAACVVIVLGHYYDEPTAPEQAMPEGESSGPSRQARLGPAQTRPMPEGGGRAAPGPGAT